MLFTLVLYQEKYEITERAVETTGNVEWLRKSSGDLLMTADLSGDYISVVILNISNSEH